MKYSIVVPVYNSEKSLEELYTRINDVFVNVIKESYELILVDDFSKDRSFAVMEELHAKNPSVVAVQLSKNCGQHAALLCGFSFASGDFVITMDDDLQHPPEEIPKLIEGFAQNDCDVVIGRYKSKKHSLLRNMGTFVSGLVSHKVYGKPKDLELTSFRMLRRNVVDDINHLSVHRPRIGNMILRVNSRIKNVTVEHSQRKYGKSGYSFMHLVSDLINNIVVDSSFPLIVVRNIGIGTFFLSIIMALYYVIKYFTRGISILGWTSMILITLFYNGVILFGIGVIGDYLIRIQDESRKMPNYFVRKILKED